MDQSLFAFRGIVLAAKCLWHRQGSQSGGWSMWTPGRRGSQNEQRSFLVGIAPPYTKLNITSVLPANNARAAITRRPRRKDFPASAAQGRDGGLAGDRHILLSKSRVVTAQVIPTLSFPERVASPILEPANSFQGSDP
jgi:hypothetical protein